MPEAVTAKAESVPPHVRLVEMGTAAWVSMIIHGAAKIGLADHFEGGAKTAEQLAPLTSTHAPPLRRLMRTLAGLGILTEGPADHFALTPLGEAMIGFHGREPAAVAVAYDFSRCGTLVDVGGATGHMLTTVLGRYPRLRGVLFDLPHVERDASELISSRGLADRISIRTGSFFDAVPQGGDAYLLSHVIHDWSEDQCLTILDNCRKAMKADGKVLIVEMVLPSGDTMHPGKILDMIMLVGPGGQERTEEEYRALLGKAGFCLTRVVPTESAVSVVEAVRA